MIPKNLIFLFLAFILNLILLTCLRLIFFAYFKPAETRWLSPALLRSLYLGLKFDARLMALVSLPVLMLSWFPGLRLDGGGWGRILLQGYFHITFTLILLIYFVDFATYSYSQTRINASLLLLQDGEGIWWKMIWQSYPVVKLSLLILLFLFLYARGIQGAVLASLSVRAPFVRSLWIPVAGHIFFILLLAASGYGKFSRYPLRWSDAFFTNESFLCQLALNPILFFFDTCKEKPLNFNYERVKEYYPLLAEHFRVEKPDPETLTLRRSGNPHPLVTGEPNVVIILLETFAAFKTGILGDNSLHQTPHFDALAQEGLLFTRFYVPMENTSRSLFAAFFGIPDVSTTHSSSRNPLVVNQHTILNSFSSHKKLYFLGGSANWGNIRGMLSHNIRDLVIYDEGSYKSPPHDVWGISDADLFMEANEVLRTKTSEPFLAIIQTAGNHRPFKIPARNRGFQPRKITRDLLTRHGFYSLEEFNGFRFLDHCLGYYFEMARKEAYFQNTVFVIFGDHGTGGGSLDRRYGNLSLGPFHVPLLIYAPQFIKEGKRIDLVASELDIMPTLASLMNQPHLNQTLGRDIFDPDSASSRCAFTFTPFKYPPRIGLIEDQFYVNVEPDGTYALYRLDSNRVEDLKERYPERAERMSRLATAMHEFARYLLYYNRREEPSILQTKE
ncbi:MAG: LTA synthase family protein [bacterium]